MYYLNILGEEEIDEEFLRAKFICIIWTNDKYILDACCSWGLSLFVLFEPRFIGQQKRLCSWGLSLFVLFERLNLEEGLKDVLED